MKIIIDKKCTFVTAIYLIGVVAVMFNLNCLGYIDEIVGLISLLYIAYRAISGNGINQDSVKILRILIGLAFIGFLGNLINSIQYSYIFVIEDAFLFFKPYIIFVAALLFLNCKLSVLKVKACIQRIVRFGIVVLTFGLAFGLISNNSTLMGHTVWVPFPKLPYYVFYARYPGLLAFLLGAFNMVLLSDLSQKRNRLYMALDVLLLFFTQSDTGLMFIVVDFIFIATKLRHRVRLWQIALMAAIGLIAGWNTITTYILNPTAARSIMLSNSIKTAMKYFPLGSGFSTYGGSIAANHYSRLYQYYGYRNIWGLNGAVGKEDFLNDSFYPWVIAEFGLLGSLVYLALIMYLFYMFNKVQKNRMPLMYGLLVILIANFGQGGITSIMGMLIFIYMAILYQENYLTTDNQ